MPGYKGHLLGGCVSYALLLAVIYMYCPSYAVAARWLMCALAGSLFPDIDVKSKGQNYFYWIIFFIMLVLLAQQQLYALAFCSMVSIIPMLVRHRGIFHRWWFIVLVAVGVWLLITQYAPLYRTQLGYDVLFFIVGAFSHLWLDLGLRRMFRW